MKHFRLSHICIIFAKISSLCEDKLRLGIAQASLALLSPCIIFATLTLFACSSEEADAPKTAKETPMRFTVSYPGQTRVADNAFENGDKIGLYVAEESATLEIGGNLVNNEALTFDGANWAASRTLYWDEGTYNAYAYYPYATSVSSIEDFPVTVNTDQSGEGYAESDMLCAQTKGVSASDESIKLSFKHIMSRLLIRLVKGDDYEGDLPDDAVVYVHNTYPAATVDLSAGVATVNGSGDKATITAKAEGDHQYAAIIVPQRLSNRLPLVEVTMKGVSYLYESTFQFKPGVQHTVNLVISDNPDKVKIEIGGEVQNWQ